MPFDPASTMTGNTVVARQITEFNVAIVRVDAIKKKRFM